MSANLYYILCILFSLTVLLGISMMSRVKTSVWGNFISAFSIFAGILMTLWYNGIFSAWTIYPFMAIGIVAGISIAYRVKMIEMPQLVALLNGIGGAASALVGILALYGIGLSNTEYPVFSNVTSALAIVVGTVTLVGSLVAAGKLHKLISQRPVVWNNHAFVNGLSFILAVSAVAVSFFIAPAYGLRFYVLAAGLVFGGLFGLSFSIRVGGADMPITISLLNSLSGVAGAIAGMAVGDIFLVAVGGIVGASGLLLTQIMCRAMNRSLMDILTGKTAVGGKSPKPVPSAVAAGKPLNEGGGRTASEVLKSAKRVIIVPGYGMALAQAQHQVRQLSDKLESGGAEVRYAIHPVAGRMPGHMNVLLAEADVPYEKLYEMSVINGDFADTDAVVVIGANDVLNPAARDAEGTPIYGMPVLNVDKAPHVIICNFDLKPGYAGVENPLYTRDKGVYLCLGDAKESLSALMEGMDKTAGEAKAAAAVSDPSTVLKSAKRVIIVPGYGMALAQAQHQVRQLSDKLESGGAEVRYAIHPVAGRMPGHMNVLLAEADVPYEKLYEMSVINGDFADTDAVVVIGANDVLNPAARDAEGTPIYGMPVLNVDKAPHVIICNFDLKPGYAGVENPLYTRDKGVYLCLGDAKESLDKLIAGLN